MMYFKCPTCGKYAEKEASFRLGDKVSFVWQVVSTTPQRARVRVTTKTGKVTSLTNSSAVVRSRGKDYLLDQGALSPANEPSPLTVMMTGVCQCQLANSPQRKE
ncbi:hypothetical protein [Salmonella enterica]|uniref:hypothetical protein n=1 Tax=Salmonella enterica TaxID=28901 RepID=UPI0003BD590D|nr:hypothetical protein [Salmonella enterica]APV88269.1 hypothetical protein SEEM1958_010050 [Salmonella enterica subsp. enterica serovar Mbandaka str. ATCC 51958]EBF8302798.1 hypothetical protein [Salmonella enterica subsp. enterica serovar Mbandaka]